MMFLGTSSEIRALCRALFSVLSNPEASQIYTAVQSKLTVEGFCDARSVLLQPLCVAAHLQKLVQQKVEKERAVKVHISQWM